MKTTFNVILSLLLPLFAFPQIPDSCSYIEKAPDSMLNKNILEFISRNGPVNSGSLFDNNDINRYPKEFIYQLYNLEKVVSGLSIETEPIGISIINVYLMNYQDNELLNATLDTISYALLEADGILGNYELFDYLKRRAFFYQ